MSYNNITPAKVILDEIKQTELSEPEYIKWLKEQVKHCPGDYYFKRRLQVMEQNDER